MPELVCRHNPELAMPDKSAWRNTGCLLRWKDLGTARQPRMGRGSVISGGVTEVNPKHSAERLLTLTSKTL